MQKIETKYHFITTNENEAPKYICSGLCKKAFWKSENKNSNALEILQCESCNGALIPITKGDYKILEFKITPQNKRTVIITYLSEVKPEFIEFAKANWVK